MLKLPFHVDSPMATGLFALAVAVLFILLRVAYDRNTWRIGDMLGRFFERRFAVVPPDKARRVGRHFMLAMAVLFGAMAAFGISVGSGLIENGDAPKPISMEEFLETHSD